MKKYVLFQVDSFTRTAFEGNPAGVVLNADGLSEPEMLAIARELNNSETAFFFSACDGSYDGELRYFTPRVEVPICGHATIAAISVLAAEKNLPDGVLRIKTSIGILPMEITRHSGRAAISMTQGKFEILNTLDDEEQVELHEALGLEKADLDLRCPIQIVTTGHSKVMIGIKSREKLNQLTPKFEDLKRLSAKIHCNGYFVFTFDTNKPGILTEGRMFAPAVGINEDPVTGNANGPLGGYLLMNHLVPIEGNVFRFTGYQGEAMGRPGKMDVEVMHENGDPKTIKIIGEAVIVFKTEISLD